MIAAKPMAKAKTKATPHERKKRNTWALELCNMKNYEVTTNRSGERGRGWDQSAIYAKEKELW